MGKNKTYLYSNVIITLVSAIIVFLSYGFGSEIIYDKGNIVNTEIPESSDIRKQNVTEEVYDSKDIEIKIGAVGDIMIHGPQLNAQYDSKTKQYSFKNNFTFIKPYIESSDLTLANLETTLAGAEQKYSSYPRFNSPATIADALKNSGFDVLSVINNHTMDKKGEGYTRTLQVLEGKNIEYIGGKTKASQDDFIIKDVKGMKIGLIAYSYETNKVNGRKTLNGNIVDKEIEDLINTFNYATLDKDLNRMKRQIDSMRQKGAEAIIFYIHWGQEYQRKPNEYQKKIAQFLADEEVDIIFGSHPHVLQPVEFVKSQSSDKQTLVVYSLGNFLSNQRATIVGRNYTEDGMIVQVILQKETKHNESGETRKIHIKDVCYVPTWVNRYIQKGKTYYEIVPLLDIDKTKYNLEQSGNLNNALKSKQNTENLITRDYIKLSK